MWGSVAICAVSRAHHSTMQAAMCCSMYMATGSMFAHQRPRRSSRYHTCMQGCRGGFPAHRSQRARSTARAHQSATIGPTMRMQMVGRHSVFLHYCYNLTTTSLFGSVMHAHRVPYVPDHECGVLLARFTSTRLAVRGGCFCFRGPGPRPQTGRGGSTD